MEKIKVTSQQLSHLLFHFAAESLVDNTEDKDFINIIGIDHLDFPTNRELLIIHLFAVTWAFQGTLGNSDLEHKILDQMHMIYCNEVVKLKALLKKTDDKVRDEGAHLFERYEEYWRFLKEKSEPNELWHLADRMLVNLSSKNINDPLAMDYLSINLAGTVHAIKELIKQYEIVS